MVKWTKSQSAAINQRGEDILVAASAGSGKTTVMIERIATMILNGAVSVTDILVLTFTKMASSEMKERLRRKLEEKKAVQQLQLLPSAVIGTFHSYCAHLVRTHATVVGVDVGFDILDEDDAKILKNEAIEQVIVSMYSKTQDAIGVFCASGTTASLKKVIQDIDNFLSSINNPDQWLSEKALASYTTEIAQERVLEHYRKAGQHYCERFMELMPEIAPIAGKMSRVSNYHALLSFANVELPRLKKGSAEELKDTKAEFSKLLKNIKELPVKNSPHDNEVVGQLVILVKTFRDLYAKKKIELKKLDFSDLEKFALQVLENHEVAAQEREKYKYIFVDEYQDTNPVQEAILCSITGTCNQFIVGDIKQSIYGFRGCDSAIFASKVEAASCTGRVSLNENFRSNAPILWFANSVFDKVMTCEIAGVDYKNTSRFIIDKAYPVAKNQLPYVEVALLEMEERERPEITKPYNILEPVVDDDLKSISAQSVIVANKIADFMKTSIWDVKVSQFRKVSFDDIVILARSKTHLRTLVDTLAKAGIPTTVDEKQKACELPEIAVINNFLFAISNFQNDVPVALTLLSPMFGFAPFELVNLEFSSRIMGILEKYHELAKSMSIPDLISKFLAEFDGIERVTSSYGESAADNVNAFVAKLRGSSWAQTLPEYLYLVEHGLVDIQLRNPHRKNCVKIMTIHGAKGLEFPIVIAFDFSASFSGQDSRKMLGIDKELGLCLLSVDSESFTKSYSIARVAAGISARQTQVADEMRLLYVALTRSKNHLIIVAKGKKVSPAKTSYEISQSKSFLDFLVPAIFKTVPDADFKLSNVEISSIEKLTNADKNINKKLDFAKIPSDDAMVTQLSKRFNFEYPFVGSEVKLKNSVTSLTKREEEVWDQPVTRTFEKDKGQEYGTLFHEAMAIADLNSVMPTSDRLSKDINKCLDVIRPLIESDDKVFREMAFLQTVKKDGADILVQGVIDLLIVKKDYAILIDYKTTRASKEKLVELYSTQLGLYADAVSIATGKQVKKYIYSTSLGEIVVL